MFAELLIKLKLEPARVVATISALIGLGVAFGLNLSGEQIGAIMALVMLLAGEAIRGKVSPAVPIDMLHEVGGMVADTVGTVAIPVVNEVADITEDVGIVVVGTLDETGNIISAAGNIVGKVTNGLANLLRK